MKPVDTTFSAIVMPPSTFNAPFVKSAVVVLRTFTIPLLAAPPVSSILPSASNSIFLVASLLFPALILTFVFVNSKTNY